MTPKIIATYPSFHSVKVSVSPIVEGNLNNYLLEICDQQPWGGSAQCRNHPLQGQEMKLGHLQMSTFYSLTLKNSNLQVLNSVTFKTKDFKVLATKCQKDQTSVLVETGPYFGGSISIEPYFKDDINKVVNKCSLRGDKTSNKSTYLYTFQHDACVGIVKNGNSSIETTLIVQENWPILTASTKRFRIACSFKTSEFTVQAGLQMPLLNLTTDESIIRKLPVKNEEIQASKYTSSGTDYQSIFYLKPNESHTSGQVVLMVILVLSALIGTLATAFWIRTLMKKNSTLNLQDEEGVRTSQT